MNWTFKLDLATMTPEAVMLVVGCDYEEAVHLVEDAKRRKEAAEHGN